MRHQHASRSSYTPFHLKYPKAYPRIRASTKILLTDNFGKGPDFLIELIRYIIYQDWSFQLSAAVPKNDINFSRWYTAIYILPITRRTIVVDKCRNSSIIYASDVISLAGTIE